MAFHVCLPSKLRFPIVVFFALIIWFCVKRDKQIKGSISASTSTIDNIFYLEVKNVSEWDPVTECCVRSAALNNPNSTVTVYSKNVISSPYWNGLNINVRTFDEHILFAGTPMMAWYQQANTNRSKFFLYELSDLLRIAILMQNGGVYMDTDMLVLKQFPPWRNAIALEEYSDSLGNAFLAFQSNSPCLKEAQKRVQSYDPKLWSTFGVHLWTAAIKACLNDPSQVLFPKVTERVTLLNSQSIFPLSYRELNVITEKANLIFAEDRIRDSFTLHVWRRNLKITGSYKTIERGSIMDKLFRNICGMDIVKEWKAHVLRMKKQKIKEKYPQMYDKYFGTTIQPK